MTLKCPCGKEATWILIYGCETYNHIWEDYLCRECLHKKVTWDNNYHIPQQIFTAIIPWTCINVNLPPNLLGNMIIGETVKRNNVFCEVTRWTARELTPAIMKRILDDKLESMRNQTRKEWRKT